MPPTTFPLPAHHAGITAQENAKAPGAERKHQRRHKPSATKITAQHSQLRRDRPRVG